NRLIATMMMNQCAQFFNVFSSANKRQCNEVHTVLNTKFEITFILRGQRGNTEKAIRQINTATTFNGTAYSHSGIEIPILHLIDHEFTTAIINHNNLTRLHFSHDFRETKIDLFCCSFTFLGRENKLRPSNELYWTISKITNANFWTGKIKQYIDWHT